MLLLDWYAETHEFKIVSQGMVDIISGLVPTLLLNIDCDIVLELCCHTALWERRIAESDSSVCEAV